MRCSDTGCHEAIQLSHLSLELAQDINETLGGIKGYGNGNGQITLTITNGVVNAIETMTRRLRNKSKKSA